MKKLNVSGADLAGFLGLEPNDETPENQTQQHTVSMPTVQVEPDNIDPEIKQKADMIHGWLLKTNLSVMAKVYSIFEAISSSEENLNEIYDSITQDISI
jgi:hypothetical protein